MSGARLPSHARQAVGLLVGVCLGIVIGQFALTVPTGALLLRGAVATFVAMMLASPFGLGPVVPIQAGVSTILVLVLGPETAGYVRLLDSCVGIVVALLFSQLLFTPDPIRLLQRAAERLLRDIGTGFAASALALARSDQGVVQAAMDNFATARESLNALISSISWARLAARWSLRGHISAGAINALADSYGHRSITLYACVLLFAEALENAAREDKVPIPAELEEHVRSLARTCQALASGEMPEGFAAPPALSLETLPESWQACLDRLRAVEDSLRAFPVTLPPPDAAAHQA